MQQKILNTMATAVMVTILASGPSLAQIRHEHIVIADTPKITRWAAVHKLPDPSIDDPYFHIEVYEHQKGEKPWAYKRLSQHMVITGAALEKSRIASKAKTYNYKDVEFNITYKIWRDNPRERGQLPVCETTIDDCLKKTAVKD